MKTYFSSLKNVIARKPIIHKKKNDNSPPRPDRASPQNFVSSQQSPRWNIPVRPMDPEVDSIISHQQTRDIIPEQVFSGDSEELLTNQ